MSENHQPTAAHAAHAATAASGSTTRGAQHGLEQQFEQSKARILAAVVGCIDNSKKGDIDEAVRPLCALLNSHTDYITTSSCSGRLAIYANSSSQRKQSGERPLRLTHALCSLQW